MGICDSEAINSIANSRDNVLFVMANRAMICAKSFRMAEEAFALSPISARAALPSEEDYAAISEAFMETSRGRWFLGEYAKRNRNADTRMVLDAVARIEENLASQKQATSDTTLTDALAAIRRGCRRGAGGDIGGARRSWRWSSISRRSARASRVIREISWRLREIGADGRICDILNSQVAVIEASAGQISAAKPRPAVDAAFAVLWENSRNTTRGEASRQRRRRRGSAGRSLPCSGGGCACR